MCFTENKYFCKMFLIATVLMSMGIYSKREFKNIPKPNKYLILLDLIKVMRFYFLFLKT